MIVDKALLHAVSRLRNDPDFRIFMDGVKARRDAARDKLECATDIWTAGQLQGESRLASELITLCDGVEQALDTYARNQRAEPGRR